LFVEIRAEKHTRTRDARKAERASPFTHAKFYDHPSRKNPN
jgi:hypothetical protein